MARDSRAKVKAWGISPSLALVWEPQMKDVTERIFRMMKEQAFHGREFGTIENVRAAVREFVERNNAEWLLAKNGCCL